MGFLGYSKNSTNLLQVLTYHICCSLALARNSSWEPAARHEYQYDNNNNLTSYALFTRDTQENEWIRWEFE